MGLRVKRALDECGARPVGGDVRTGPGDRNDGPGEQRQREDKHHRAEPACRQVGRQERQGREPVERKPGDDGKPPCKRRPNNDLRGICPVIHGGSVNPLRKLSFALPLIAFEERAFKNWR